MSTKWKIYHNPRCSKSREALALLKENKIEPEVIEYLKEGLEEKTMKILISKSKNKTKDFIRRKEKEFNDYKNLDLETEGSVAKILSQCPKLLERPIVVKGEKVIIARPPELIKELL